MKTVHGIDGFSAAGRFVCHIGTCRKAFFHATKLKNHYQEHGIQISKLGAVLYSLKHLNTYIQQVQRRKSFPVGKHF